MEIPIVSSLPVLLQLICVIIVVAYLLTKSRGLSANKLGQEILNAVRAFTGYRPQSDDITLIGEGASDDRPVL